MTEKSKISLLESDRENLLKFFDDEVKRHQIYACENLLLNSALSELFNQKNFTRAFHKLSSNEYENYLDEYIATMVEVLYKFKKKQEMLRKMNAERNLELFRELDDLKEQLKELKEDFKTTILQEPIDEENPSDMIEDFSDNVPDITEKDINNIFKLHNAISTERLKFIKLQDNLHDLEMKDKELDDIGESCSLFNYENLETQLQSISTEVDTINEDLEKLRERYKMINEKRKKFQKNRQEIEHEITEKKNILKEKKDEIQKLRLQLNSIAKQKKSLRSEMEKLLQKSQLLNKMPLLKNFDSMSTEIERVEKEKLKTLDKIQELKNPH